MTDSTKRRASRRRRAVGTIEQRHVRRCPWSSGRPCQCAHPSFRAKIRISGRVYSKTFGSESAAAAWLENLHRIGSPLGQPAVRSRTINDVVDLFLRDGAAGKPVSRGRPLRSNTMINYRHALDRHIRQAVDPTTGKPFVEQSVDALDDATMQRLQLVLMETAGLPTVHAASSALAAALRYSRTMGYRTTPVPRGHSLPRATAAPGRTLSEAEVLRVVRLAYQDDARLARSLMGPFCEVLVQTGLRGGEAFQLRWDDVDLGAAKPYLRVRRETTKSDAGARQILLEVETRDALLSHQVAGAGCGQGLVFSSTTGAPLNRSGLVRAALRRIAKQAGVAAISPHDFRRTHATMLAVRNCPPAVAARRLGHSDGGSLFLKTYAHPSADEDLAYVVPLGLRDEADPQ